MPSRPAAFWFSWLAAGLCWAAALFIACDSLAAVIHDYSALPYFDQWEPVLDYTRLRAGHYSLHDLLAQHNEHRIVLPRLLFWADYDLFGGLNIFNLALIAGVQLVHAALLIRLLGRPWRQPQTAIAAAAVVGLMLSLGQWENLTWGFQTQFVGVFALATGALMLIARSVEAAADRRRMAVAFSGAMVLLLLASVTMANGMAAMAVAAGLALALGAPLWMPASLLAVMVVTALLYFRNFTPQSDHSNVVYALTHLDAYIRYVLTYLGTLAGSLEQNPRLWKLTAWVPAAAGAAGLAFCLAAIARVVRARGQDRREAVLAAVMLFIVVTGALTALGRVSFGLEQAYASRYRTPDAVFWAAVILFWSRVARPLPAAWPRLLTAACALLATLGLVYAQRLNELPAVRHAASMHWAEDDLLSGANDYEVLTGAYPYPDVMLRRAGVLRAYGRSLYRLPRAHWLGLPLAQVAAPGGAGCLGAFDEIAPSVTGETDAVRLTGWAWDGAGRRPVRRVLITGEGLRVIGFASTGVERPDVVKAMPRVTSPDSGWLGFARAHGGVLHAFALLDNGAACEIGKRSSSGLARGLAARKVTPRWVGPSLAASPTADSNWTAAGTPSAVAPAPAGVGAYASWSGADSRTGDIRFGPFQSPNELLVVGLVAGPDAAGQSIAVADAKTGAVLARTAPPLDEAWTWTRLKLPPGAIGRPLILIGSDQGAGPGQWFGMTEPHVATPPPPRN